MNSKILEVKQQFLEELKSSENTQDLEALRVKYLGKKGELTAVLRGMGQLSAEERQMGFNDMIKLCLEIA